jgi:predicted transcriptional regulator
MEVRLNSDLQAKLNLLAAEKSCDSQSLVVEAVERMVNDHRWFFKKWKTESPPLIEAS